MKITAVESHQIFVSSRNLHFVKIRTDEGIEGIGEAYSAGPDAAVAEVIADFARWLMGRDPLETERLWQLMYNGTRFPPGIITGSAMSGIEHALWDIKGKALGVPVYELLGGRCRDRIRVYQGVHAETPEALAERAVSLVERYGYTALKMNPQPRNFAALSEYEQVQAADQRVGAVREAVGPNLDLGVDAHARFFEPSTALAVIEAIEPYRPYFVEEPIRPENVAALADLRSKTSVPIATGECLYNKFQFQQLLLAGGADIVQPDVCLAGGLLELKKIAAMAEAFYVTVAPHNPMGPVATAVNVHFAASTPNFKILEYKADDDPARRALVKEPVTLKDGYLQLPEAPGLGVELDMDYIEEGAAGTWHRPFIVRDDGSIGYQ